jgi:hypothetical protein
VLLSIIKSLEEGTKGREYLNLRLITGILMGLWLLLVLLGKGGFIHLLLLSAVGVAFVDLLGVYRSRITA